MSFIAGHAVQIKTLTHLANRGELSHGYLFYGPEMVGKRTVALALAEYLEHGTFKYSPELVLHDALAVEPDEERTIGIDAARRVRAFFSRRPNVSRYRMVVIDGAEFMTGEAQNALLKTAEDAPPSACLILVARGEEILFPTLRSRLHGVYFPLVASSRIAEWLVRERGYGEEKAAAAAGRAFGAPGRAFRFLADRAFMEREEQVKRLLTAPTASRRALIREIIQPDDFDLAAFLDSLILAAYRRRPRGGTLLARALALRGHAASLNVNPRLQLEALFAQR